MAAKTHESAEDAFIEAQRLTLSCISDCTVFGRRAVLGQEQTLTSWERGQRQPNQFRLITHGGVGELDVRIALNYVVEVVGVQAFAARTTHYQYLVSDIAGQELVIYDWHPAGVSPITTPHLHVPAAASVVLAQRAGTPRADARTYLGSLHLPTGPIRLAEVVRMLITEFQVVPIRSDWERVLQA